MGVGLLYAQAILTIFDKSETDYPGTDPSCDFSVE